MSQPVWECIGQLGDASPTEYGGYWIFRDKTGVYVEEAELLICPEEDEDEWDEESGEPKPEEPENYEVRRFSLERCTWTPKLFDMGVLSDNKYHPDHAAWWAAPEGGKKDRPQDSTYLSGVCSFADVELDELRRMFCSEDALQRAQAYRLIGEYHGWANLDDYPLMLTKTEVEERYKDVTVGTPR